MLLKVGILYSKAYSSSLVHLPSVFNRANSRKQWRIQKDQQAQAPQMEEILKEVTQKAKQRTKKSRHTYLTNVVSREARLWWRRFTQYIKMTAYQPEQDDNRQ